MQDLVEALREVRLEPEADYSVVTHRISAPVQSFCGIGPSYGIDHGT